MSGGYNGWSNWSTWNVALWIDNDEYLYRMRRELKPRTGSAVESFVRDVFPKGTPDMSDPFDRSGGSVDWDEIAEHWAAEDEEESEDDDSDSLDDGADAEALASAGMGTDEDYGHFGGVEE